MKKYILITLMLLTAFSLLWCQETTDKVDFTALSAKVLYMDLLKSDQTVAGQIAWSDLIIYSHFYHTDYEKLTTEAQRLAFQKDFITKFPTLGDKVRVEDLTDWRTAYYTDTTVHINARGEDFDFVMIFNRTPEGNKLFNLYTFYDSEIDDEEW